MSVTIRGPEQALTAWVLLVTADFDYTILTFYKNQCEKQQQRPINVRSLWSTSKTEGSR